MGDSALPDVAWFHPDGREMREQDWQTPRAPVVAWLLGGDAIASRDAKGKPLTDDSFLVIMNGSRENVTFRLPDRAWGARWTLCVDTREAAIEHEALFDAGTPLPLAPNVVMVFRRT